ncbi:MAG: hypothetical protein HQK49_11590 [Oligoflexia bacterium]|nr:hypothetical protein [Oligoflexia bacterium]
MQIKKKFFSKSLILSILLVAIIFLHTILASILPARFESGDTFELVIQMQSLVFNGKIFLDKYHEELPKERKLRGTHGRIYSKYSLGLPLLSAIYFKIYRLLTHNKDIFPLTILQITSVLIFFISGICFWLILQKLNCTNYTNLYFNLLLTFGFLFSTIANYYSYGWPGNSVEASLIFISFTLFFFGCDKNTKENHVSTLLFISGIILGFAGFSRSFAFITVPAFIIYFVLTMPTMKMNLRRITLFLLPVIFFIILHFVVIFYKLGEWGGRYSTYASFENFDTPFYIGFLGSLLWPGKSFIFFSPLVILGVCLIYKLYKNHKALFFFSVYISLVYIILMSKWWAWWSGSDIGQRFWVPIIPFLIIPIAFLKSKCLKAITHLLIIFGVIVQFQLYHNFPRGISESISEQNPLYRETDVARVVSEGRLFNVIKLTFWDMVFFKNCK